MKDINELTPEYKKIISQLDCELYQIFERRDILSGRLDGYCRLPYQIVFGFPASIGEQGNNMQISYEEYPEPAEFYNDVLKEIKDYVKKDNFMEGRIYCPSGHDEKIIKIARKILRTNKKLPVEKWQK